MSITGHHRLAALLAGLVVAIYIIFAVASDAQDRKGWQLESGVDRPTYATISPTAADIDIVTIMLTCNDVGSLQALQLELYPSGTLPLIPAGATASDLRDDPHLQLLVDDRVYPVSMFFADDHIVVSDTMIGRAPAVSRNLMGALANGRVMKLRFQLLHEHSDGRTRPYDAEADVDLQAGGGGAVLGEFQGCHPDAGDRLSITGSLSRLR